MPARPTQAGWSRTPRRIRLIPYANQLTHSLKQRYPGFAVIVCPYQVEPELRLSVPAGTDPAESSRLGAEIEF